MAKTMVIKPVFAAGTDPATVDGLSQALEGAVAGGFIEHLEVSVDGKHVGNMIIDEIVSPDGRYKAHKKDHKQDRKHPHPPGHQHPPGEYVFHFHERD